MSDYPTRLASLQRSRFDSIDEDDLIHRSSSDLILRATVLPSSVLSNSTLRHISNNNPTQESQLSSRPLQVQEVVNGPKHDSLDVSDTEEDSISISSTTTSNTTEDDQRNGRQSAASVSDGRRQQSTSVSVSDKSKPRSRSLSPFKQQQPRRNGSFLAKTKQEVRSALMLTPETPSTNRPSSVNRKGNK
jgi:hypothetical protein